MATRDLPECVTCNRQLNFYVLKHRRPDGRARYTIGVWQGTLLRSICHAASLSGGLLALSGELQDEERSSDPIIVYPKWSDLRELAKRLRHRGDDDGVAAAAHLEDLHARLHSAVADQESTLDRLTKIGALLEQAAAKSQCIGDCQWTTVAIPDDTWSQLLKVYRGAEGGNLVYRELQLSKGGGGYHRANHANGRYLAWGIRDQGSRDGRLVAPDESFGSRRIQKASGTYRVARATTPCHGRGWHWSGRRRQSACAAA